MLLNGIRDNRELSSIPQFCGATTFSITTISIATFSIATLSMTTLSIMMNKTWHSAYRQSVILCCLCWVSHSSLACWLSLCWVSSCWMSWRLFVTFFNVYQTQSLFFFFHSITTFWFGSDANDSNLCIFTAPKKNQESRTMKRLSKTVLLNKRKKFLPTNHGFLVLAFTVNVRKYSSNPFTGWAWGWTDKVPSTSASCPESWKKFN